jgi:N-acetylmuramoyl-L-alanine amidase
MWRFHPAPFVISLLALAVLSGCGTEPLRANIPSVWQPSPNFDLRRPDFVILHHTGSADGERALATLSDPVRRVSAHYLVARDGKIYQLVDERARAWHAGASRWGWQRDMNSASLGIELDNDGTEDYPEVQVESLLTLLADIAGRYPIPAANYLGHGDVAPGRKFDPGSRFPWKRLADKGFGLWCDAPYPEAPAGFDPLLGLAAMGYDARRPEASLSAFRVHFRGMESDAPPGPEDAALIHCLLLRKNASPAAPDIP